MVFENKLRNFIPSALLACFLSAVVISLFMVQPGKAYAAAPAAAIGVVDYALLLDQHPDTKQANEALKTENEQAKKDFEAKSANMSDKDKRDLYLQLGQRMEQKQRELLGAITDKINTAVKAVADAKGITTVVNKNVVIYGGQDITNEVMQKMTEK